MIIASGRIYAPLKKRAKFGLRYPCMAHHAHHINIIKEYFMNFQQNLFKGVLSLIMTEKY